MRAPLCDARVSLALSAHVTAATPAATTTNTAASTTAIEEAALAWGLISVSNVNAEYGSLT